MTQHTEEMFADALRSAGREIASAHIELARAEAKLKQVIATTKVNAMGVGIKANNAQEDYADRSSEVFEARMQVGVCRAALEVAVTERKAVEMEFEAWRTKQANRRSEGRVYGHGS